MKLTCPCCSSTFVVDVDLRTSLLPENQNTGDWRDGLTEGDIAIVELAEKHGLLGPLSLALLAGPNGSHPPRFVERFLLEFLRSMKPRRVPSYAMVQFKELYPDAKSMEFYSSNGVGLVAVNGKPELFLPIQIVLGQSISGTSLRMDANPADLKEWVRGKYGYVPADSHLFLSQLQKRSPGEFVFPVL